MKIEIEQLPGERWRDVPVQEYGEHYAISDKGRAYSARSGKLLASHDVGGYQRLSLRVDGKIGYFQVHRLVLAAFVPDSELVKGELAEGLRVFFHDGDHSNCELVNLYAAAKKSDKPAIDGRRFGKRERPSRAKGKGKKPVEQSSAVEQPAADDASPQDEEIA
jgi:hypothetical protein